LQVRDAWVSGAGKSPSDPIRVPDQLLEVLSERLQGLPLVENMRSVAPDSGLLVDGQVNLAGEQNDGCLGVLWLQPKPGQNVNARLPASQIQIKDKRIYFLLGDGHDLADV
jgi:hypothetical protein